MRRGAAVRGLIIGLLLALSATPALAADPLASAARIGLAPPAAPLALVLPLSVNDAALHSWALEVATPGSPAYHHFESIGQLARRFGASRVTIGRVVGFLRRAGAQAVTADATGLFVDATLSAGLAQRLFSASLAQFHSARDGRFIAPTAAASIPRPLRGLISGVVGLDTRPLLSSALSERRRGSFNPRSAHGATAQPPSGYLGPPAGPRTGCPGGLATQAFTPNQYLTAYGYGPLRAANFAGQGERVALIEIDGFNPSDIQSFANCFSLPVPTINLFGVGSIRHALAPGGESTLDLEILDAAAPGLKAIDVYESKADSADALRALTAPLQVASRRPQVISASLGKCEPLLGVSRAGLRAADDALAMAGASGVSVLAATGDSGSAACAQGGGPVGLAVSYPASSWWVTAVGGTNLFLNSNNTINLQPVWNDTFAAPGAAGGGGISDLWTRPPYQNGVVGANRRAVPDVSALGDIQPGYAIFCTAKDCVKANPGQWHEIGGTSAATPLMAAGFALVDQYLRGHKRADLGLANPLLYDLGRSKALRRHVFSDVTVINNDVGRWIGGHTALGCCTAGRGFDEASGWGSINLNQFALDAVSRQQPFIGLSLPGGQRPVHRHAILATVSCVASCRVAAIAEVKIGHAAPFLAESVISTLRRAGHRTLVVSFSSGQLGKLRSALRHHKQIAAAVEGVAVNSLRYVVEQTGALGLKITG